MRRFLMLTIAMTVVIVGLYVIRDWVTQPVVAPSSAVDPIELDRRIEVFEDRVETIDPDPLSLSVLGRLYLLRARTGYGVDDYLKAREVLTIAAKELDDAATLTALAGSHLALHEFTAARHAAQRSWETDPGDESLAVLADAEMALGAYDEAAYHISVLASRIPDEPSYLVRAAQFSFLTGDIDGALELSARAARHSTGASQSRADQGFYLMIAGRFRFETGDYRKAASLLEDALALDPRHPGVLFELGRVRAAQGDLEMAIDHLEQSVDLIPEPSTLSFLGDLYLAVGEKELSDRQYATIEAIATLGQTAYRRPVVAAFAARGLHPERTVELARDELEERSDPTTWHVYALALFRAGHLEEAHAAALNAIGPVDARLLYHVGLIAAANGLSTEAQRHLEEALRINPDFHPLEAELARELLEELGS
ncbi:MAG: tetratricopeptide repeat protein [Acidimicrobiia bacterium]